MLRSISYAFQVLCVFVVWVILPATPGGAVGLIDERFVLTRFTEEGAVDNQFGDRGIVWTPFWHIFSYLPQARGEAMAMDREGRIIVAGWVSGLMGAATGTDMAAVRYLPDGRLDPTFGKNGRLVIENAGGSWFSRAYAVAVSPEDGVIFIVGEYGQAQEANLAVFRYQPKSENPPSPEQLDQFPTVEKMSGRAVVIDKKERILVAGHFKRGKEYEFALARYLPNGQLDTEDFDAGENSGGGVVTTPFSKLYAHALDARAVAVGIDDEGGIAAAGPVRGTFELIGGAAQMAFGVVRYLENGQLDSKFSTDGLIVTHFGPGSLAEPTALAVRREDIVVTGTVTLNNKIRFAAACYDIVNASKRKCFSGKSTAVFPSDHNATADAMIVDPSNKILIAGTIHKDPPTFAVLHLNDQGKPDAEFGTGNNGWADYEPVFWNQAKVGGIALQGKDILLAGYGRLIDGLPGCGSIPPTHLALDWDLSEGEVKKVVSLCNLFHQHLYDALDGQVSIEGFTIHDRHHADNFIDEPLKYGQKPFQSRGILTQDIDKGHSVITVEPSEEDPYPGRPDKPDVFQISPIYDWQDSWLSMFKFWCAAYTGAALEWPPGSGPAPHNCVLGNPTGSGLEPGGLCRGLTYNPTSAQGQLRGMSCYEWIAKTLGFPGMSVPTVDIWGPFFYPKHWVLVGSKHILPQDLLAGLRKYEYKEGLRNIHPAVIDGLILFTPEGKKVTIGMSAHCEREHPDDKGYTNGKLIVDVADEKTIDRLEVIFTQYHHGGDLSSIDHDEVGFDPMSGSYDTYAEELLKKSREEYRVWAAVEDISSIEWQYWKAVRFGSDWPGGWVWGSQTGVDIFIQDEGRNYALRLSGTEDLDWDVPDGFSLEAVAGDLWEEAKDTVKKIFGF